MNVRLLAVAAVVSGLVLSTAGAQAAPRTLDGRTVKTLTMTANGGLQSNDKDQAQLLDAPDRADCAPPRCSRLPFVYKPARGVRGDLMFTVTWTNRASDIDLYVGEVNRDGSTTTVDSCGGVGTTSEKVFVPAGSLRPGRTYVLVVDWFRSINETATAKVQIGVPSTIKTTVPTRYDGQAPGTLFKVNCTQ